MKTLSVLFLFMMLNLGNSAENARLDSLLSEMKICSPQGYAYVMNYTHVFMFWGNNYDAAYPGGITFVSEPLLKDRRISILQLVHEARHHYQFSQISYWPDWARYDTDQFARFRIESEAHAFASQVAGNCY